MASRYERTTKKQREIQKGFAQHQRNDAIAKVRSQNVWAEAQGLKQQLNQAMGIYLAPAVLIRNEKLMPYFGSDADTVSTYINSLAQESRMFMDKINENHARHCNFVDPLHEEHFMLYVDIMEVYSNIAIMMDATLRPTMVYLANEIEKACIRRNAHVEQLKQEAAEMTPEQIIDNGRGMTATWAAADEQAFQPNIASVAEVAEAI